MLSKQYVLKYVLGPKEPFHADDPFEYPQHMLRLRNIVFLITQSYLGTYRLTSQL